ncbi:MAG TPA: hypothetical protein VLT62_17570 [Candidatus Methylomirabilis sp.]|nr:hypothetical protein [Candidatus Methylomirabilis sp.]
MSVIPEALVGETWQEVASLSPTQAREQMSRIAKSQPDLLAFVMGTTGSLRTDAQQVGVYLLVVIHCMFEKLGGPITRAKAHAIDAAYERNQAFLERFEGAHPRFLENAAGSMVFSQPFVMKYLVDALMEPPEGDEPLTLSEEETGLLFLVLKTVVDILDELTRPPSLARDGTA